MSRRRVVLLRHGETAWNASGRWQGHGGGGLSELGRSQAERTARYLAATRDDVVRIVRSDLERVGETAAPLVEAFGVPVDVDARWREIDVGTWSGLTHEEVRADDPDGYRAWREGGDPRRGGGETDAELGVRVGQALGALASGVGTVLVVTHGGPVRHAVAQALALGPAGHRRFAGARNCSVTELVAGADGWTLAGYNSSAHLLADQRAIGDELTGTRDTRGAAPQGRGPLDNAQRA